MKIHFQDEEFDVPKPYCGAKKGYYEALQFENTWEKITCLSCHIVKEKRERSKLRGLIGSRERNRKRNPRLVRDE